MQTRNRFRPLCLLLLLAAASACCPCRKYQKLYGAPLVGTRWLLIQLDGEEVANALKIAGRKHDLVGIRVFDPREAELPDVGIAELQDAETGRKVWVDTSSAAVRDHYARAWRQRSEAIDSLLKHNRIDTATISTDEDYVVELIKLFKQR